MSYSKTNWTLTTPINPKNLNKIEQGIADGRLALNINVADTENRFAGTNVETVINELYGNVVNGKSDIKMAIQGKGSTVADADGDGVPTFAELVSAVNAIIKATGDATVDDVLSGKTFSKDGQNGIIGTMTNQSGTSNNVSWANADANTNINLTVPKGYYDGSTAVITSDADLIPANIRKDKNVFGVTGDKLEFGAGDKVDANRISDGDKYTSTAINEQTYFNANNFDHIVYAEDEDCFYAYYNDGSYQRPQKLDKNGGVIWQYYMTGLNNSQGPFLVEGYVIFCGASRFMIFTRSGTLIKDVSWPRYWGFCLLDDGTFITGDSGAGRLRKIEIATGNVIWEHTYSTANSDYAGFSYYNPNTPDYAYICSRYRGRWFRLTISTGQWQVYGFFNGFNYSGTVISAWTSSNGKPRALDWYGAVYEMNEDITFDTIKQYNSSDEYYQTLQYDGGVDYEDNALILNVGNSALRKVSDDLGAVIWEVSTTYADLLKSIAEVPTYANNINVGGIYIYGVSDGMVARWENIGKTKILNYLIS